MSSTHICSMSNRAEFVHFVFLFLHVAPLRSSVARPSSKTNTEAFVIVSRSLMNGSPPMLSVHLWSTRPWSRPHFSFRQIWKCTWRSIRNTRVLSPSRCWGCSGCVYGMCFFQTFFFFFFFFSKSQARPLVFLDATWKSHPWYFSSVQCKPVGVTGLV